MSARCLLHWKLDIKRKVGEFQFVKGKFRGKLISVFQYLKEKMEIPSS